MKFLYPKLELGLNEKKERNCGKRELVLYLVGYLRVRRFLSSKHASVRSDSVSSLGMMPKWPSDQWMKGMKPETGELFIHLATQNS